MGRELCPNPGAELKLTFLAERIFLIQIRPYSYSYQSSNCNYTNFCRRWTLYHVKNKTDNKISSVDALRELRHIDLVKWHTSRKFNCRVARCYFYVGALLTKTTFFLLKLRVPAVAANEVYMCKALISVQLNLCRGTVKNFKYQNKGRMLQKSRRQSILLPLTNTTMEKKPLQTREKAVLKTSLAMSAATNSTFHRSSGTRLQGSCPKKAFLEKSNEEVLHLEEQFFLCPHAAAYAGFSLLKPFFFPSVRKRKDYLK